MRITANLVGEDKRSSSGFLSAGGQHGATTAPSAWFIVEMAGDGSVGIADCYATVTSGLRYTSWTAFRSCTPSFMGRWKALRPEIRPVPPARLLMTAVATASSKSLAPEAPPLLMSPARPMKQLATW